MAPIPRLRAYSGPALLSYGFRPFFLFGAIYSGLAILAWLPIFYGELRTATAFVPRDWHIHEMLYGYVPAVVTGFLLTAIPNWTGRLPIQGLPLLALLLVWLAGRFAVTLSAYLGWLPAAVIDGAFLVVFAAAIAREIVAGRNWRNLKIVMLVALLAAGNIAFHIEAHVTGAADYGLRIGIGATVILIGLVGGRIVPSFTRNWLVRENPGRLPAPFGRFDMAVMIVSAIAVLAWIAAPLATATGAALLTAGVLHAVRLARWAGERTIRDRLVLILHLGYAFIPLGFLLTGAAALDVIPAAAAIHAWAGGAIGAMTLAVMTRASLGHSGHALTASAATQTIYAAVIVAALARICAALHPVWSEPLLHIAAFAWAAAFLGFAVSYGPMLIGRRAKAKAAQGA